MSLPIMTEHDWTLLQWFDERVGETSYRGGWPDNLDKHGFICVSGLKFETTNKGRVMLRIWQAMNGKNQQIRS